jgi:hypothetical protein
MSASPSLGSGQALSSAAPTAVGPSRAQWIGVDLSSAHDPRRTGVLVPLLALALITALGVAALRIDLIRTRYAVAAVLEEEQSLLEEQRALLVRRRQLRDPVELAKQAQARGFRPPARAYSLPDPVVRTPSASPSSSLLPPVAAAPADRSAPALESSPDEATP